LILNLSLISLNLVQVLELLMKVVNLLLDVGLDQVDNAFILLSLVVDDSIFSSPDQLSTSFRRLADFEHVAPLSQGLLDLTDSLSKIELLYAYVRESVSEILVLIVGFGEHGHPRVNVLAVLFI